MTISLVSRSLHVVFECCINLAIATGHIFICNSCNKEKIIQQMSSNLMILHFSHFFVATLLHFGPFIEKLSFS
jgi:hypothetical protein